MAADATKLDLPPESLDVVFSNWCDVSYIIHSRRPCHATSPVAHHPPKPPSFSSQAPDVPVRRRGRVALPPRPEVAAARRGALLSRVVFPAVGRQGPEVQPDPLPRPPELPVDAGSGRVAAFHDVHAARRLGVLPDGFLPVCRHVRARQGQPEPDGLPHGQGRPGHPWHSGVAIGGRRRPPLCREPHGAAEGAWARAHLYGGRLPGGGVDRGAGRGSGDGGARGRLRRGRGGRHDGQGRRDRARHGCERRRRHGGAPALVARGRPRGLRGLLLLEPHAHPQHIR